MNLPVYSKTKRRLAALFSVPVAFSVLFFLLNQNAERRETELLKVQHLANALREIRSEVRDAESGERGFLLWGEDRYLVPLDQTNQALASTARNCLDLARDNPKFLPKVRLIVKVAEQRLAQANQSVAIRRRLGFQDALAAIDSGASESTMTRLRGMVATVVEELDGQELSILQAQHEFARWSFLLFSLGSVVMIIVIVWLYNALLKYLAERDIANANLTAANTHLEARIADRTRDLTQANQELQQFAYVASHDLQEPLRTITSFSQLLASRYRGKLDADADEFIGYIVSSSKRMTDLINGLLAMVRLRKAGQPTTPVSFEGLVKEAQISLQAAIRESGAEIVCGPLPALVVDSVQFSQVVQNLISNAIKYRSAAPPRIQIGAKLDGSQWLFWVKDNGRGFDPQFADRIFGLFQRLHVREVEGTGMGLSIAKRIVERHGGRMWAESAEGQGSTFYFSLPVTLESGRDKDTAEAAELSETR
jgi:signal transduction histidine kinase